MERMTGARALVEVLKQEGIQCVFHLPGSQIIEILDEIYQSPIRAIMCRHEQGAAFMADGYARALRVPGICLSTVGPGAVNLISGVAASFKASVPVIAITGIHNQKMLERDGFHEIDQVSLFRPVTKWSTCIHLSDKIPELVRKAFRIALSGRKGPVHLAIPSDVSRGETDYEPVEPSKYRSTLAQVCPEQVLDRVIRLLEDSRFPVILAGGEVLWSGASKALQDLAGSLQVPVATTRNHPDAFPASHPLGMGLLGRGRGEAANRIMKRADLILAVGVKFDYQTTRYNYDIIPRGAKIIHVSVDPDEVGRIYPVEMGIVCDSKAFLKDLLEKVRAMKISFGLKKIALEIKEDSQKVLDSEIDYESLPLRPETIARTLRDLLPPDTIVTLDGGNFAKHVRRHFQCLEKNTMHYPDDFGSVGAGFPMSLGVKVAKPDRPVVCMNGDGAFLLNCQELETAVREQINVMVVVFNDSGFGNVRAYQKLKCGGRYMCDHGNPPFGEMARLFGAQGAQVETLDQLKDAVKSGLKSNKPYVIDVKMTRDALEEPGFLGL
ncbi:MAG: thiamine pyrophosphate-binding protein [Deltaproteobacteria bacterium]|nr:thiamine pyrophosphate-binding protein [Deltaproteobacteria bacterium]